MEKFALPASFTHRMRESLGTAFADFENTLRQPAPVSIRTNPKKMDAPPPDSRPIPWCTTGFYLPERPSFTLDPHFHAGAYYVQEASSMFIEQLIRQHADVSRPLRVLDACAAPGGKSTHLISLLNDQSLLVTNEVIRSRAAILSENMQKWGYPNVVVTENDPKDFSRLPGFFDIVLVDAPCSGEGLFRKDPDAIQEWSEDNVKLCSLRQQRILTDVWPSLKEGGLLIYSTCTYNEIENEGNLQWLQNEKQVTGCPLALSSEGIQTVTVGKLSGYRFFPHRTEGEGFFVAGIRKNEAVDPYRHRAREKQKTPLSLQPVAQWLQGDFDSTLLGDLVISWPSHLSDAVAQLAAQLNVVTKGVAVARVKQNKWVPEHALALSTALQKESFQKLELSLEEAIRFLRKDNLFIANVERGFLLVAHKEIPLGWVNSLGNRFNNLYPSNWRIRMEVPRI